MSHPAAEHAIELHPERHLETLIGLVHEAALDPSGWHHVARALSDALDGNGATIWIRLPGTASQPECYRSRDVPLPGAILARHWSLGLPWGTRIPRDGLGKEATQRFVECSSVLPDEELARTGYYREWMAPQGLPPVSPYVHVFAAVDDVPTGCVVLFQREGHPPLRRRHIELADQLVPHFKRAHRILDQLRAMRREQDVFREVIDRIPSGIVLVDEEGRVVAMNESARDSVDRGGFLRIHDDRPVVEDPEENRWLQEVLERARDPKARAGIAPGRSVVARRSATDHAAPILVTPLLAPASESTLPDTAAMILLGSPNLTGGSSTDLLRNLYGLTRAEAELTLLLADGRSLEEAAAERSVTLNTARSQLKRVFVKTGAKRQSELVRIVLGGVGAIRESD